MHTHLILVEDYLSNNANESSLEKESQREAIARLCKLANYIIADVIKQQLIHLPSFVFMHSKNTRGQYALATTDFGCISIDVETLVDLPSGPQQVVLDLLAGNLKSLMQEMYTKELPAALQKLIDG